MNRILSFIDSEEGASSIEYAMLAALIAVVCIVAFENLAQVLGNVPFNGISNAMKNAS